MNNRQSHTDLILVIHFLAGAFFGVNPNLVFYFTLLVFLYFVYRSIQAPQSAQYGAAYIIGLEMLMRMSRSSVPHEFAKYAVVVLLLPGILKKKIRPLPIIIYGLLQIPAFFFADGGSLEETRQLISFNFSGPLCLVIATIYFYNKPVDALSLKKIFIYILYPIASILGFLLVRTPAVEEITFGFGSNFRASNYGPNQMSSVLGLVILVLGFCYFFRLRLFKSYITFFALLFFATYRGLLTFSRGGIIAPVIILICILIYLYFGVGYRFKLSIFLSAIMFFCIAYFLFDYVNNVTENALFSRYTGVTEKGSVTTAKYTSSRNLILAIDWEIFKANPIFGVGIGMAKFYRRQYLGVEIAAHIEYTRLLAEHGIFGLLAVLLLVGYPIIRFFQTKSHIQRALLFAGAGFCLIFMLHSATRIAAPCFLYGLGFVQIVSLSSLRKKPLRRTEHVTTPGKIAVGT